MELRNISIAELAAAVAALPGPVREELAKGPLEAGGFCRLCKAIRVGGYRNESELKGAVRLVYQWHEDHDTLIARGITDTFVDGDPSEAELRLIDEGLGKHEKDGPLEVARTFAGAISYYRLCLVYLLAGWRPSPPPHVSIEERPYMRETTESPRL